MRLGGPVFDAPSDPEGWAAAVRAAGYGAALCPVEPDADAETVDAFARAAEAADVVIAEAGAWSNPLSRDATEARGAVETCKARLALADRIGARCCVNIAGSRGTRWDAPHPDNLSDETFDRVVETVREILDAVRPVRTFYTVEAMPWVVPDSPDAYLALLRAVDRDRFAVHLDPVNLVTSPRRYYENAALVRECFAKLGPHVKSCHAKDIALEHRLTVHLDEVRPGLGGLDYRVYLEELDRLDPDTPLMLEHLPGAEAYAAAAAYLRGVAGEAGIALG